MKFIRWFSESECSEIALVGGKNASLSTMLRELSSTFVKIPNGFAVTTNGYWYLLDQNNARQRVYTLLAELPMSAQAPEIAVIGKKIRKLFLELSFPNEMRDVIVQAYEQLCQMYSQENASVAVRSSASAEDLPTASFAGQQESFLHIAGHNELIDACQRCYASLFTDRAISYRQRMGFDYTKVALSVGVQKMVLSSHMSAGVGFSIDTQTGFEKAVIVEASYGLGEMLVKGRVIPDKYVVYKRKTKEGLFPLLDKQLGQKKLKLVFQEDAIRQIPVGEYERLRFCLSDEYIQKLTAAIIEIEAFYSNRNNKVTPMDIEWAIDDHDKQLYIVQARPETVHAHVKKKRTVFKQYCVQLKDGNTFLAEGVAIGRQAYCGTARRVVNPSYLDSIEDGDIIVTTMSDPDWVPLMKKAGGIITELGGRTCHAAIVARELDIPAIVGVHEATKVISDGVLITIDCTQSERGMIYQGLAVITKSEKYLTGDWEQFAPNIMVSLADPSQAFSSSLLPVSGVGLMRLEFVVAHEIGIHPLALIQFDTLLSSEIKRIISAKCAAYDGPIALYVDRLAFAISTIAAAFEPRPVIVRLTDFKTNEYRGLVGGQAYEPHESNPMLGFRGAARYTDDVFLPAFELECQAIRRSIVENGFSNVIVMVPFVRTVAQAKAVCTVLRKQGLDMCLLFMMIELPSNVIMLETYSELFDGFSIGSNDLTQFTLGIDRDSARIAHIFNENDQALLYSYKRCASVAKKYEKYLGFCGQGPTDNFEFAQWLLANGVNSVSVSPHVALELLEYLSKNSKFRA